jgi:acetyl esterase/lipase
MNVPEYMKRTPATPGIRIPYGSEAPDQFGDLRVPSGAGPFPVAVVVHGGWWRSMFALTYAGFMSEALTSASVATWNIEFRRVGDGGGYPNTLYDVTDALDALRRIARGYPLDLARVVVTGHSAGGQIAAWLASKPARRELDKFGEPFPLLGAVSVSGALDLKLLSEMGVTDSFGSPARDFLGGMPNEVPTHYANASPAALLPTGLPVIAIHGSKDDVVPPEISRHYVSLAQAAGDPAKLIMLDGVEHFTPFDPSTEGGGIVCDTVLRLLAP